MALWLSADLHFSHANIIDYAERPFRSVEEMNEAIIDRWNAVVSPDDTVWVLGDVALGKIAESLPLVGHLMGHKILLAGNHDRVWFGHTEKKTRGWTEKYLEYFDEVVQGVVDLEVAGHHVLACHFPYYGDSKTEERYPEFRPKDEGKILLCGHVHQSFRVKDKMINVGVDQWNFTPVAAEELHTIFHELGERC